jgi:hypothetical protein
MRWNRSGACFYDGVWSEGVTDAERQTPSARSYDRTTVLAIFCWARADSTLRRRPNCATAALQARWPDHDPSRIAFGRGNGDFVLHAWRGHGELPDSDAEPPFADQHEPFVRRF